MSQTLRFGVFIVVVMAGFALAFHAVFASCEGASDLGRSFGTFPSAMLYVFEAPLGEFSFEAFDTVSFQCPDHPSPGQASDAGTVLLVVSILSLSLWVCAWDVGEVGSGQQWKSCLDVRPT